MDIDIESESGCVGFMLEVEPDTRPDIFQVASVAFRLAGRDNSIKNFNVRLYCLKLLGCLLTKLLE
jgi:hypothetical protein